MKGVVFLGERKLEIRDFPDPEPGPREVVLEIKASGMCGSDLHAFSHGAELVAGVRAAAGSSCSILKSRSSSATSSATVSRLLTTLEARGLVEQSFHRGRYRLGYGVVQLAAGATKKHDPICQDLAETVGETVKWLSTTVAAWSVSTR